MTVFITEDPICMKVLFCHCRALAIYCLAAKSDNQKSQYRTVRWSEHMQIRIIHCSVNPVGIRKRPDGSIPSDSPEYHGRDDRPARLMTNVWINSMGQFFHDLYIIVFVKKLLLFQSPLFKRSVPGNHYQSRRVRKSRGFV